MQTWIVTPSHFTTNLRTSHGIVINLQTRYFPAESASITRFSTNINGVVRCEPKTETTNPTLINESVVAPQAGQATAVVVRGSDVAPPVWWYCLAQWPHRFARARHKPSIKFKWTLDAHVDSSAIWIEMNQRTATSWIHPEDYGHWEFDVQAAVVGDKNVAITCSSERQCASRTLVRSNWVVYADKDGGRVNEAADVAIVGRSSKLVNSNRSTTPNHWNKE